MSTDAPVTLEASVRSINGDTNSITFKRRTDRNEVLIVIETPAFPNGLAAPIQHPILVSAIALRSACETILDGPDAPQS